MSKSTISPFSATISTPPSNPSPTPGAPVTAPYVSPFAAPVVKEVDSEEFSAANVPDPATDSPLTGRSGVDEGSDMPKTENGAPGGKLRRFSEGMEKAGEHKEIHDQPESFADKLAGIKHQKKSFTVAEKDKLEEQGFSKGEIRAIEKLRTSAPKKGYKRHTDPKDFPKGGDANVTIRTFGFVDIGPRGFMHGAFPRYAEDETGTETLKPFSEGVVPKTLSGQKLDDFIDDYLGRYGFDDVPEGMGPKALKEWRKRLHQVVDDATREFVVHSGYESIIDSLKRGLKITKGDAKDLIRAGYTPSSRKKLSKNERTALKKAGFNPWIKLWMKGVEPFGEAAVKPFSETIENFETRPSREESHKYTPAEKEKLAEVKGQVPPWWPKDPDKDSYFYGATQAIKKTGCSADEVHLAVERDYTRKDLTNKEKEILKAGWPGVESYYIKRAQYPRPYGGYPEPSPSEKELLSDFKRNFWIAMLPGKHSPHIVTVAEKQLLDIIALPNAPRQIAAIASDVKKALIPLETATPEEQDASHAAAERIHDIIEKWREEVSMNAAGKYPYPYRKYPYPYPYRYPKPERGARYPEPDAESGRLGMGRMRKVGAFSETVNEEMEKFAVTKLSRLQDIPSSEIKDLAKTLKMRTATLNRALKHVKYGDIDALTRAQQKAVQNAWPELFGKLGTRFEYRGIFSEFSELTPFSETINMSAAKKEELLALLKGHGTKESPSRASWGGPCKASFKSLTGMPFSLEAVKKAWGMAQMSDKRFSEGGNSKKKTNTKLK